MYTNVMSPAKIFALYALTFAAFLLIDLLWLGVIAKGIYAKYLGYIMTDNVRWLSAFVFYALFVGGLIYFSGVLNTELTFTTILKNGLLFGFFTYMTYELTNHAVIRDWPNEIVFIDIAWGVVLGGITTTAAYFINGFLKGA